MKKHWLVGGRRVVLAMLALAVGSAGAAVFDDFEGYTLGDQWHNDATGSNVPAGWDRNTHYGLYDPNNVLEIRADPADSGNQALFMSMQPEESGGTTRNPAVTWTAPAGDPWTGNFTVSFDLRLTPNHAISTRVWLQGDGFSAPRLFIQGDGRLTAYNAGTILEDIGTASRDQWYRVIFDLNIAPYTGDPDNASFFIRAYEIDSGEAALGDLLGEMTTPSLFTSTGAGFQQVRFDGRSAGRQEMYLDSMSVIPEPGTLLLLLGGGALLPALLRRRAARRHLR